MVKNVIPQHVKDYRPNLIKLKPAYVVHGDDWKSGILKESRDQVIKELKKWSGKLIELKYTKNISSAKIKKDILSKVSLKHNRTSSLKRLIQSKKLVRVIEAHSPLVGLIIENLTLAKKNKNEIFDAMWSSSLTESLIRGKPDNQSVELSTRINALSDVLDVTSKPFIFDADNGGRIEHLPYTVNSMERQGVSAIVIEDKIGFKRNSLFKDQKSAQQDSIKNFSKKIKKIKDCRKSEDFLIVARIESFILGKGLNDALKRAYAYSRAGADAILIHSKENTPNQIFSFSKIFKKSKYYKPMIAVPSSYSKTYEKDLLKNGFSIVIYANHLLRASYKIMKKTALDILKFNRSYEAEKNIVSVKDILNIKAE
jgi:phosphoenolpyruvate phosphomutase